MKNKIILIMFFGFLLVGSLFVPQTTLAARNASAIISPTVTSTGQSLTYTYTVTNDSSSTADIGSIEIQLPTEFENPSINVLSASSDKTWVLVSSGGYINGFNSSTGKIGVKAEVGSGVDSDKLDSSEFVEIQITTTSPNTPNSFQWTAFVWANVGFNGDPIFELTSQPTVEVTAPIVCIEPQVLNAEGDTCIDDVVIDPGILECTEPQVLNEDGDECINEITEVIVCAEPQFLIEGVCTDLVTEPLLEEVSIHLEIISGTNSLYDNVILVKACDSDDDPETSDNITAYCALSQSEVVNEWSGLWINSIGDYSNDFSNNLYWMWLANLNTDNTDSNSSYNLSAKQYLLNDNDHILFYFNTNPLNISVSDLAPIVGDEITIIVKELGADSSFNPLWIPIVEGKVMINLDTFDLNENGEYTISITNTDFIIINAQKDGYIDSPSITINPVTFNQEEDNEGENNNGGSSGGGGGSYTPPIEKDFSVSDALDFLLKNKESASVFVYDWIAIAAGVGDNSDLKSFLMDYLKSNPMDSSIITENERRAMALMSLGINPYDGTEVDYIKKIIDSFNGTQLQDGSGSDFNDDIFGLIVLQNAGYQEEDEIIEDIIKFIISNQSSNGSWGSVDMTSAGIMALNDFEDVVGVSNAISKAENYLIGEQKSDGSFGNSFATSWAIQALSLNSSYDNQIKKAIEYLANEQQDNGGLNGVDINSRVWATAYATPAVLGLSWTNILNEFSKPKEVESPLSTSSSSENDNQNEESVPEPLILETNIPVEIEPEVKPLEVIKKEIKTVASTAPSREDGNEIIAKEEIENAPAIDLLASAGLAREKELFGDTNIIVIISIIIAMFLGGFVLGKKI